jgi:hypothetical protein
MPASWSNRHGTRGTVRHRPDEREDVVAEGSAARSRVLVQPSNRVGFSGDDLASHERGYPALLDIVGGLPVGGLVFAQDAVAGDLWLPGGERVELRMAEITGWPIRRLYPEPRATSSGLFEISGG